jgi:NAD(P)-dependent dehydrogenase (short-subunit alcohol dehydrogenase family)
MSENSKVAIVTGGAGGIGSVISRSPVEQGYCFIVTDADEAAARRVAAELSAVGQIRTHPFAGDLATTDINRRLVREATAHEDRTALVNAVVISPNAPNGRKRPFLAVSEKGRDLVIAVNLEALSCRSRRPTRSCRPTARPES